MTIPIGTKVKHKAAGRIGVVRDKCYCGSIGCVHVVIEWQPAQQATNVFVSPNAHPIELELYNEPNKIDPLPLPG